jgi:hypothetical protein
VAARGFGRRRGYPDDAPWPPYRITKGSPLRDHEGVMRFSPTAGGGTHLRYEIRAQFVAAGGLLLFVVSDGARRQARFYRVRLG